MAQIRFTPKPKIRLPSFSSASCALSEAPKLAHRCLSHPAVHQSLCLPQRGEGPAFQSPGRLSASWGLSSNVSSASLPARAFAIKEPGTVPLKSSLVSWSSSGSGFSLNVGTGLAMKSAEQVEREEQIRNWPVQCCYYRTYIYRNIPTGSLISISLMG